MKSHRWEVCVTRTPAGEPLSKYPVSIGHAETLTEAIEATASVPMSRAKGACRRVWAILPFGQEMLVWHDE